MEKSVSDKNTKAQILDAYEKLLKDVEGKSGNNPKEMQQRKTESQTVRQAAETSPKSISDQIGEIKTEFVSSLEKMESALASERSRLQEIQNAIRIEEKHLEDLYGLTANADSFSAILLAQKEQEEQFEREMASKKELLSGQIEDIRCQWEKEKEAYEENLKAEKEHTTRQRRREEDEYAYTVQQTRKQEQDEYAQMKHKQDMELKEQRTAFEREFAEREKSIVEKEGEFARLQQEAESFSARLAEAVEKAQGETESRLSITYQYEKDLREKETGGILNLKDHQIKSLEAKIKEMETQLKEASQKVDTSERTVKDIALKAIENATRTQIIEKDRNKE